MQHVKQLEEGLKRVYIWRSASKEATIIANSRLKYFQKGNFTTTDGVSFICFEIVKGQTSSVGNGDLKIAVFCSKFDSGMPNV